MRLLGRGTSSESSPATRDRQAPRGGWYADPFGAGDERWWDGNQWTREVRGSPADESVQRSPKRHADNRGPREGPAPAQQPPAQRSAARPFPVTIEAVVEEPLSIVPSVRKPGAHCQVLASRGRAGSISVFGGQTARVTCAHGTWFLKRSPKVMRGLAIESADRKQAGRYVRRRWLPGGTIRLLDGTEVELRRSRPGRWKVRSRDGRRCVADVRRAGKRSRRPYELKVTVHSLSGDVSTGSMIVLVACALLILPDRSAATSPRR